MRFTVRDLLWLTTVAGALLALAVSMRNSNRLHRELSEMERKYRTDQHDRFHREGIYKRELEKISGRKVTGLSTWAKNDSPGEYGYEFEYDFENRPPAKKSN